MRLHGNDIDETTTAVEADLGWIVGWKKDDFIGAARLRDQKANGSGRKLVGFEMLDRGIFLPPSQFEALFVSSAHSDADIDATLSAARASLAAIV